MIGLLGLRNRQLRNQRARESERPTFSGVSDQESERVGISRRKRLRRRGCSHDPSTQALAQWLTDMYHWLLQPTHIKTNVGNGLGKGVMGSVFTVDTKLDIISLRLSHSTFRADIMGKIVLQWEEHSLCYVSSQNSQFPHSTDILCTWWVLAVSWSCSSPSLWISFSNYFCWHLYWPVATHQKFPQYLYTMYTS